MCRSNWKVFIKSGTSKLELHLRRATKVILACRWFLPNFFQKSWNWNPGTKILELKSWNFKIKITSQKSYKGHLSLQVVSAQLFMDDFGAWIILVEPQNPFSNALQCNGRLCLKPSKYHKGSSFQISKTIPILFYMCFTSYYNLIRRLFLVFSIAI